MNIELPTADDPVKVIEGDCLDVLRALPDGCVDAVITDPPYFGVVGHHWDNQWASEDDYLAWVRGLCDEWQRLLKPVGSLYVFASPHMASRVEGVIRGRFQVLASITWHKDFPCGALKYGPENFRNYVAMSERVVFAGHENPTGNVLRAARMAKGFSRGDMDVLTRGRKTGLFYRWEEGDCTPSVEQWQQLSGVLDLPAYEDAVRPFFADMIRPYSDVWVYKPVAQAQLVHPCEKPLRMMRDVLLTCTRPGALVLDCFAGSGTTGIAAALEGRRCLLIEKEPAYAAICRERVRKVMGRDGLFADA